MQQVAGGRKCRPVNYFAFCSRISFLGFCVKFISNCIGCNILHADVAAKHADGAAKPSMLREPRQAGRKCKLRFIYIRNQTEKPHSQHRPETLLHKECNKLMLLRRNEAVDGLVSLRMTVNAM